MRTHCPRLVAIVLIVFSVTACAPAGSPAPALPPTTQTLPTALPPTETPVPTPTASPAPSVAASPAATAAITETVKLDDITMYYAAYGEGEPLFLLHGWMVNSDIWKLQVPAFAQQYRVITPDLRGQGRTTDGEAAFTYDLLAADIVRLMDYLKIDQAYFIGWDYGAITGLELARSHPERVRALVAYAVWMRLDGMEQVIVNWLRNATFQELRADMNYDYTKVSSTPDHLPVMLEKLRTLALTESTITPDQLASITPPTLLLYGAPQELLRSDHPKEVATAMPQAEFVLIPGTGGYAPLQKPGQFNQIVLDFLKDK